MTTPETTGESGRTAGSKLGWLIAGRLVTALLLSVFGTIWIRAGESQQSINKSLVLLTIVAGLTIAYAVLFRLSKNILLQARLQLANISIALHCSLHSDPRDLESVPWTTMRPDHVVSQRRRLHRLRARDHGYARTNTEDQFDRWFVVANSPVGRTV